MKFDWTPPRLPISQGYWPQQQQTPKMVQVIMVRPATGSKITFDVPQGTSPEQILQENPGWIFSES